MTLVKASLVGAAAAFATLAATAASATTYDFTLLDTNATTIDASGVLALTGNVIEGIAGTINGYGAITGLIPNPNSPNATQVRDILFDNLLDTVVPGVDNYGIFVTTSSGANINLFNRHSGGYDVPDNTAAVYVDNLGYVADGTFSITAVPEPASWGLMLVGIGLAGATLRSSPRQARARTTG